MYIPYQRFFAFVNFLMLNTCVLAAGNSLEITVNGIRDDQGTVRAGIFRPSDGFPKEAKALAHTSATAQSGIVLLKFTDLPAGQYALIVFHDENNDGQMNKRFGMIPIEGYGLSNNIKAFGKPSFDECAFAIPETYSQTIDMRY